VEIADDWIHHNNAPAHKPLSFREFLAKKCIPVLAQAPYSPETCDFYVFPKLKSRVKSYPFQTPDSVQKAEIRWAKCCIRGMLF
jgi:hypothetical protein